MQSGCSPDLHQVDIPNPPNFAPGRIYINIKQLLQTRDAEEFYVPGNRMDELPKIHNAFLLVENGIIMDFGNMVNIPKKLENTEGNLISLGMLCLYMKKLRQNLSITSQY